nr:hypothetical protein NG677_20940 [Methylobacterium sp. OTU13CASTA1]
MRAASAAALGLLWTVSHAFPCDCPFPKSLQTDAERSAYRLEQASVVATVRVTDVRLRTADLDDPKAIGNATVIKWVKGHGPKALRLVSYGADEGANCGLASTIFNAASQKRLLTVQLHQDSTRKGSFWIGNCSYNKLDEFGSASLNR